MLALAESVQVALVGLAGVLGSAGIGAWVTVTTNRARDEAKAADRRVDAALPAAEELRAKVERLEALLDRHGIPHRSDPGAAS